MRRETFAAAAHALPLPKVPPRDPPPEKLDANEWSIADLSFAGAGKTVFVTFGGRKADGKEAVVLRGSPNRHDGRCRAGTL